mmetsp:Transcript_36804/g.88734  ORF Transcript_36804/g.88734 Transcript_36804/m.88734 type:complete len:219 (-) Transcript_36804:14-670(-)
MSANPVCLQLRQQQISIATYPDESVNVEATPTTAAAPEATASVSQSEQQQIKTPQLLQRRIQQEQLWREQLDFLHRMLHVTAATDPLAIVTAKAAYSMAVSPKEAATIAEMATVTEIATAAAQTWRQQPVSARQYSSRSRRRSFYSSRSSKSSANDARRAEARSAQHGTPGRTNATPSMVYASIYVVPTDADTIAEMDDGVGCGARVDSKKSGNRPTQ